MHLKPPCQTTWTPCLSDGHESVALVDVSVGPVQNSDQSRSSVTADQKKIYEFNRRFLYSGAVDVDLADLRFLIVDQITQQISNTLTTNNVAEIGRSMKIQ